MRVEQNFQVNRVEYLTEAMTLYGTYIADSIEEIVGVINQLHKTLTKSEKMLGGREPYWYEDSMMVRRITYMILNSSLYLHES